MEWFKLSDALFKVHAACKNMCESYLCKPIRVHIKYSKCNMACSQVKEVREAIAKNFSTEEVTITQELSPKALGFADLLEIWIVGGNLLHSKRFGNGWIDSEEKRLNIINGINAVLGKPILEASASSVPEPQAAIAPEVEAPPEEVEAAPEEAPAAEAEEE